MKTCIFVIIFCALTSSPLYAQNNAQTVDVKAGDTPALIQAINNANNGTGPGIIFIRKGDSGETGFTFTGPAEGSDSALPDITSKIALFSLDEAGGFFDVTFTTTEQARGMFRLARVIGDMGKAELSLSKFIIEGFGALNGDGGAIEVSGDSTLRASITTFRNNSASGNGGAIATTGTAKAIINSCNFMGNQCEDTGGAISAQGMSTMKVDRSMFSGNSAGIYGCDANFDTFVSNNTLELDVKGNHFVSQCERQNIENPKGWAKFENNTFFTDSDVIDSTGRAAFGGSLFSSGTFPGRVQSSGTPPADKEALCNDFGSNAFQSLGYNIAADNSCALDQATDLPGTDPMVAMNADGLLLPQPGSPAIDSGAFEVVKHEGDELISLPCSYRDIAGTARPQDGNGDGIFECDMGAMEVPGAGDVVAGHSGAFFNASRDGEGTYVEVLNDTTAIVYTFTYRPDGSGPAWFIGVGTINENAIVIDDLLRPVGTSFGAGFNTDDVEFTPAGGMSMVFPDCTAAAPGGNVAYTGDPDLGYEGLITRATRLSNITGCGAGQAHANAGLSGSYFDPARDGEGIIVEWLTNGDILVVFFTYDQNDNQMWLIGIGTPNGKSVTMDALYPSTFSQWGSVFDANDVTISNWGTFSLTWTECNAVAFEYSSTVAGYGSASRDYARLSTLQDTSCPGF